jgi:hypothetical protein
MSVKCFLGSLGPDLTKFWTVRFGCRPSGFHSWQLIQQNRQNGSLTQFNSPTPAEQMRLPIYRCEDRSAQACNENESTAVIPARRISLSTRSIGHLVPGRRAGCTLRLECFDSCTKTVLRASSNGTALLLILHAEFGQNRAANFRGPHPPSQLTS